MHTTAKQPFTRSLGILGVTYSVTGFFLSIYWLGFSLDDQLLRNSFIIISCAGSLAALCGMARSFFSFCRQRGSIGFLKIPITLCALSVLCSATSIIPLKIGLHERAIRLGSSLNTCVDNLRTIDGVKQSWAINHKKQASDTPSWNDITNKKEDYYVAASHLHCPEGGIYSINCVSNAPSCTFPGHYLP